MLVWNSLCIYWTECTWIGNIDSQNEIKLILSVAVGCSDGEIINIMKRQKREKVKCNSSHQPLSLNNLTIKGQ